MLDFFRAIDSRMYTTRERLAFSSHRNDPDWSICDRPFYTGIHSGQKLQECAATDASR